MSLGQNYRERTSRWAGPELWCGAHMDANPVKEGLWVVGVAKSEDRERNRVKASIGNQGGFLKVESKLSSGALTATSGGARL